MKLPVVIAISCLGSMASAQPLPEPESVRPGLPGPIGEELGVALRPSLVREGSFISQARGQLIRGKTGRWFFVFDPDGGGRMLPPMVVLPNQHLAAMERVAERAATGGKDSIGASQAERVRMSVTGMVTAYRGLNYLLPTAPPLLLRADAAPVKPVATEPEVKSRGDDATGAAPRSGPTESTPAADEPSIDEIVTRLDKAVSSVSATAPLRVSPASAGGTAPSLPVETPAGNDASVSGDRMLPPGVLASRRGRVVRGPDGALLFRIDSGVGGSDAAAGGSGAGGGGMLTLLPSQNLTSIEQVSERAGEGATYTMSGDVFAYRGRNYLLVRSYQVNRASEQVMPAQ